jgi:hypothetical protein
MSKARQNPTTLSDRRRFLRLAGSCGGATMRGSSQWSLAFGLLFSAYAEAEKRSYAAYMLADADRDMLTGGPTSFARNMRAAGSLLSEDVLGRGYSSN